MSHSDSSFLPVSSKDLLFDSVPMWEMFLDEDALLNKYGSWMLFPFSLKFSSSLNAPFNEALDRVASKFSRDGSVLPFLEMLFNRNKLFSGFNSDSCSPVVVGYHLLYPDENVFPFITVLVVAPPAAKGLYYNFDDFIWGGVPAVPLQAEIISNSGVYVKHVAQRLADAKHPNAKFVSLDGCSAHEWFHRVLGTVSDRPAVELRNELSCLTVDPGFVARNLVSATPLTHAYIPTHRSVSDIMALPSKDLSNELNMFRLQVSTLLNTVAPDVLYDTVAAVFNDVLPAVDACR